jgi:hypothetical protein
MSKQTNLPLMQQTSVPEVVLRTVEHTLRNLKASKVEYIIRLPDGTLLTHGDMELAVTPTEKKRTRIRSKMPVGYMTGYLAPTIEPMQVGDVVEFATTPEMAMSGVSLKDVQRSVSSIAFRCFGSGNHKVYTNKKTQRVELLRVA